MWVNPKALGKDIKLRNHLLKRENRPNYLFAKAVGINAGKLSRYASGLDAIPPHHLFRLCEVLKCDAEDIIGPMDEIHA